MQRRKAKSSLKKSALAIEFAFKTGISSTRLNQEHAGRDGNGEAAAHQSIQSSEGSLSTNPIASIVSASIIFLDGL